MEEIRTEKLYNIRELPYYLRASAASVIGTRAYQEDCLMYQILEDGVLGVVCDGMGGLSHGEASSACAVDALSAYFRQVERDQMPLQEYWEDALHSLDKKVAAIRDSDGNLLGGGTTMAAVFVRDNYLTYAAVGDSMIYLFRKGECKKLVRMHNYRLLLDQQLENGLISLEEYQAEQDRGEALITYLGMNGIKIWDCAAEPLLLEDGDKIILCSDGLYKGLSQQRIQKIVDDCDAQDFEMTALELIRAVFKGPPQSLDNISILCFGFDRTNVVPADDVL